MEKHHEAMLEHVTEIFHRYDNITDRKRPFRNKLDHTLRVLAWVRRIAEEEGGDLELLTTCAIFHDVGYTVDPPNHPAVSARMCDEYLAARGFDEADCTLVGRLIWEAATEFETKADEIRAQVADLVTRHPIYE